jgi:hypothetical protein
MPLSKIMPVVEKVTAEDKTRKLDCLDDAGIVQSVNRGTTVEVE